MDVSNFTVLIVDDEPTTRKILMHFLQKAGYASKINYIILLEVSTISELDRFQSPQRLKRPRVVKRPYK
jgi:CheY-like chemotaxis protein